MKNGFEDSDKVKSEVPPNAVFCMSKDQQLQSALSKLKSSEFFKSFERELYNQANKDASNDQIAVRAAIPFETRLLNRIAHIENFLVKKTSPVRTNVGQAKKSVHEYSFAQQVSIFSPIKDATSAMKSTIEKEGTPNELIFLVLWALKDKFPLIYEQLMRNDFMNHASESLPEHKINNLVPVPYDAKEPPFVFAEGDFIERTGIHPTELVNTLITGTTGAGKTFGGVIPLLKSFLSYKNSKNQWMSMLVIDPKFELEAVCRSELEKGGSLERLTHLGKGHRLRYFHKDCPLSLVDRYYHMAEICCTKSYGEGKMWLEKSHRMNIAFLQQDRDFYTSTGLSLLGLVHSLITGKDHLNASIWFNLLSIYRFALTGPDHLRWVNNLMVVVVGLFTDFENIESEFKTYAQSNVEMLQQFFYRANLAEDICCNLSHPEVTQSINTDLFPIDENDLHVDDLLVQGKIILLQPSREHTGDLIGRLIKARYFNDIFERSDMLIPIGYVADEFQRFITSDRSTGEQSFLDRCRAYRVNCVLATQSIAALQHALSAGDDKVAVLSTQIIVANSPTKLVFRSTDDVTSHQLRNWLPSAPGEMKHVVDVRPISSLKTGYAYYMLNGDWGYCKYQHRPTNSAISTVVTQ